MKLVADTVSRFAEYDAVTLRYALDESVVIGIFKAGLKRVDVYKRQMFFLCCLILRDLVLQERGLQRRCQTFVQPYILCCIYS